MKKMQEIGHDNRGPGGCETQAQCEYICSQPQYIEECMNYSVDKGMMSAEQADTAMMMGPGGPGGPGGCRGEEECEEYCSRPENLRECVDFSVKQGMMPAEEADEIFKSLETPPEIMEHMPMPEEGMPIEEWKEGPPPEGMPPEEMIKQEEMMPPEEWIEPEWPEEYRPPEEEFKPPEEEMKPAEEEKMPLPAEIAPRPGEETIIISPEEPIEKVEPIESAPVEPVPIIPEIQPVEEPQTFFDVVQNFLASAVSMLGL